MPLLGLALAVAVARPLAPDPILWLHPSGKLFVTGQEVQGRLNAGAKTIRTPYGLGIDFAAGKSGFLIPDFPALRLTHDITVSTWLFLRSYTPNGFGAQILFRGDDRIALDPYHLTVGSDGKVGFGIDGTDGDRPVATASVPLKAWVHVTGVFDEDAGELRMYVGAKLVSTVETQKHPFANLEAKSVPGIGIGNVQNDRGPHNQPLDGIVADLRLYNAALKPSESGYAPNTVAG